MKCLRWRDGGSLQGPLRFWALTWAVVMLGVMLTAQRAPAATLSGRVSSGGQPVAGAFVAATGPRGHGTAVTDASGGFSVSLPDGTYELASNAPGYAAAVDGAVKVGGASVHDLSLAPSGASLKPVPVFGGRRDGGGRRHAGRVLPGGDQCRRPLPNR
ncbi:MAG TPA: carboxypeptidase-like regulatory domain-containing protein [Solirubrobacteraceae bacterium]